jgi:DNA-binding CsgD family transcriptional regulator
MYDPLDRRFHFLLALALSSIVVVGGVDIVLDQPTRWLSVHTIFEVLMIAGALVMATTLWLGWWRAEHASQQLRESLARRTVERDMWQRNARQALAGFGQAIDEQFQAWELTPTEREVALLLLKGHSYKAIAKLTGRSAATIRQHAAAVYQKGGLSGRAQLAAHFLDDLVLPSGDRSAPATP